MKRLLLLIALLICVPCFAQPILRQLLTTNAVLSPSSDGQLLTTVNGFPTFANATFSNVTFTTVNATTINVQTNFTTNAFFTTEYVTNLNVVTNLTVDNINSFYNTNITFNTNVTFVTNVTINGKLKLTFNNAYVGADGNGNLIATNNGSSWTNLTYQYTTNAIPGAASLTFGQAYTTNLTRNITLPALTINGTAYYETIALWVTNGDGSDHTVTFPGGVVGPPGSGTPPVLYCTNKQQTFILLSHYALQMTNVWKQDMAP